VFGDTNEVGSTSLLIPGVVYATKALLCRKDMGSPVKGKTSLIWTRKPIILSNTKPTEIFIICYNKKGGV